MQRIIKQGDMSQGHCWPATTPIPNLGQQKKVYINNLPVIVVGDNYNAHPGPCGNQGTHAVATIVGSNNVFVGGLPVVRDGDPLSCGDIAKSQSGDVYCN